LKATGIIRREAMAENQSNFPVPPGYVRNRQLLWLLGGPLLVLFGCGVASLKKRNNPDAPGFNFYVILFSIGVACCVIGAVWDVSRRLLLLRRGVEVAAYVIKHGMFTKNGMCSITIRYDWRGKRFEPAFAGTAEQYPIDSDVVIVIDPKNPKCYVEKKSLLPKSE
jgi:hypothetical protein